VGTINVLEANSTYYFIQRRPGNWDTIGRYVYSNGEIAYISVILALYCIGLIGCIYKIGLSIYLNGYHIFDRLGFIVAVITSFFIFRVVLFSLVLSNGLVDSTSPAPSYVLVEFPIILYFIFVSNYIILWVVIKRKSKHVRNNTNMIETVNIAVILTNTFVFAMFILCIILYETIVANPFYICGGQIVVFDSNTAFIILMVYRAIFSTIEILFGIALIYSGLAFVELLKQMTSVPTSLILRTQVVSIVGSLGLIMQGIYLLVIVATKTVQVVYLSLSILIVVEIIPAMVFLSMCEVKPISADSTHSHGSQKQTDTTKASLKTPASRSTAGTKDSIA